MKKLLHRIVCSFDQILWHVDDWVILRFGRVLVRLPVRISEFLRWNVILIWFACLGQAWARFGWLPPALTWLAVLPLIQMIAYIPIYLRPRPMLRTLYPVRLGATLILAIGMWIDAGLRQTSRLEAFCTLSILIGTFVLLYAATLPAPRSIRIMTVTQSRRMTQMLNACWCDTPQYLTTEKWEPGAPIMLYKGDKMALLGPDGAVTLVMDGPWSGLSPLLPAFELGVDDLPDAEIPPAIR